MMSASGLFQSQTRRLLPRNLGQMLVNIAADYVSIADATLASPQQDIPSILAS